MQNNSHIETFWTKLEQKTQTFRSTQCANVKISTLHDCIEKRMQESSIGSFLYHLNSSQVQENEVQQDKLDRLHYDIAHRLEDMSTLDRRNDICHDLLQLIQHLLQDNVAGTITEQATLQELTCLRLTGSEIKEMDWSVKKLKNLKALVLAGNCISSVRGRWLPRNLQLLEMCCNQIQDLTLLTKQLPPYLLYLGLGRNYLTQDDLSPLVSAKHLYHLDLSHNEIQDLQMVTTTIFGLHNLSSLMLYGNPCSMAVSYKEFISVKLPKLIFLDGEILKILNLTNETHNIKFDFSGSLRINMFRVMGLTQPPKRKINNKKTSHTFRIEVDCPVLKSFIPDRENSFVEYETLKLEASAKEKLKEQKGRKPSKLDSSKINKTKNTDQIYEEKPNKPNKQGNKLKESTTKPTADRNQKAGDFTKDNEEEIAYKNILKDDKYDSNTCFTSDRKSWAKIVEFSEPTIEVPNCDLSALRDVFKSVLTVRVVHLETLPPPGNKKTKLKSKKGKDSKNADTEEDAEEDQDLKKEILVSKTTEVKFKVCLQDIFWSEDTLDFSWNKLKPLKVSSSQGLKDLQYVLKKKKPTKPKKEEPTDLIELQVPKELTCHIGIGVKRNKTHNFK